MQTHWSPDVGHPHGRLEVQTGKGNTFRKIDVLEICRSIDRHRCKVSLVCTTPPALIGVVSLWVVQRRYGSQSTSNDTPTIPSLTHSVD